MLRIKIVQSQEKLPDGTAKIVMQVRDKKEVKEFFLFNSKCKPNEFENQRFLESVLNYKLRNSILYHLGKLAKQIIREHKLEGKQISIEEFENEYFHNGVCGLFTRTCIQTDDGL